MLANLRLSLSVLVEGDLRAARRLRQAKDEFRQLESRASENHLDRLAQHRAESIQTSALHLDLLRDLKRVNAHLAAIATEILTDAGEMAETRLRSTAGRGADEGGQQQAAEPPRDPPSA